MLIEIGAPASLPLGLVRVESDAGVKTCLLGLTVQHPPVHLRAQAHSTLQVTGARADKAYEQATRFLQHHFGAQEPRSPGAQEPRRPGDKEPRRPGDKETRGQGDVSPSPGLPLSLSPCHPLSLSPLLPRSLSPWPARIEIELAIPAFVGLGSEAMLGLSVAQALAWVNGLPLENTTALAQAVGLEPQHALEVWGFDRGGLLLVDTPPSETRREGDQGTRSSCPMNLSPSPPLLRSLSQRGGVVRRQEIAHPDKEAWAFVFFFPRVPPSLESDRLRVPSGCLLAAAPHLSSESGRLVTEKLWPAVENDDIAAFGQSLMALQQMNREALAAAGTPHQLNDEGLSRAAPREAPGPIPRLPLGRGARDQAILALMRDHGAFAWGQSLTGLGLFGLVKGAAASVELRTKLRHQVGFFAGRIMATITDNSGARHVVKDENLR